MISNEINYYLSKTSKTKCKLKKFIYSKITIYNLKKLNRTEMTKDGYSRLLIDYSNIKELYDNKYNMKRILLLPNECISLSYRIGDKTYLFTIRQDIDLTDGQIETLKLIRNDIINESIEYIRKKVHQ